MDYSEYFCKTFFLVINLLFQLISARSIDVASVQECKPKFENQTFCGGQNILNSASSFAALLRRPNSGYSIYQSNIWIILLHSRCHKDLDKLLCSMYAPLCLKSHFHVRIYPCREMCESVRRGCLPKMNAYGFGWPTMTDCNIFPSRTDDKCIDLTDKEEIEYSKQSKKKRQREDRSLNSTILSDEQQKKKITSCSACQNKTNLKLILKMFCDHSLVVRTKISSVFNRPGGFLSIHLNEKSETIYSKSQMTTSLTNLLTELSCTCPEFQTGRYFKQGRRWLLFGDIENGQFVIRFMTKWRRKHKRFRKLIEDFNTDAESYCKDQHRFLQNVRSQTKRRKKKQQISENDFY